MPTNSITKEYLEKLITDLVGAGEEKEELSIWIDLYDILSSEERNKLVHNLEKELKDLQELK
jgi:hypothetical protein